MTSHRLLLSILIIALIACLVYLQLPTPNEDSRSIPANELVLPEQESEQTDTAVDTLDRDGSSSPVVTKAPVQNSVSRKRLQINGRVVDEENRPIANALISEERYLHNTRTDLDGKYNLILDLPKHRYPVLYFLRSGYTGQRIALDKKQLKLKSVIELDVNLTSSIDSVTVKGWVGNDIGAGLKDVKLEIASRDKQTVDSIYLNVFSDEDGNFSFEGVQADVNYKLSVKATSEYSPYQDLEFKVSQNPQQLSIVLDTLKLIDIDGMIVNTDNAPVSNFEIYLSSLSAGAHVRKIVSDSSGFFTLRDFPLGEVSLSTRGPNYFKISGLTLTGNEYSNLMLVVDKGHHHLSGWVSDKNGVAVVKALVTVDSKLRDGAIEYFSYRSKATDSAGNFSFSDIGSGNHQISVYANGFNKQEVAHKFKSQTDSIHIILSRYK